MTRLEIGQELPVCEVIAKNYGADHANKIHSDEGAAKYGFAGALVPGVGLYAYLTRSAVSALGLDWLERGAMSAKFIKPIYDSEKVQVKGFVVNSDPVELKLELINSEGEICAVGSAGLPASSPTLDLSAYPVAPLPPSDRLRPASISSFQVGDALGSLDFSWNSQDEGPKFLDNVVETAPIYTGPNAACHPAYLIAQANEALMKNVALGPWIHTASETRHYSLARAGEKLSLRGRAIDLYTRRSHEFIVLDLAFFADHDRLIARIRHTAIIRLHEP
jgi:acyl dehydratase